MRDLAQLAEQIRVVRDAERRFMHLWRIEQVLIGPDLLDRLAADMAAAHRELEALAHDAAGLTDLVGGGPDDLIPPPDAADGYPRSRNWPM